MFKYLALSIIPRVSSLSEKILARTVLLNALPLNAINYEMFTVACKRTNLLAVKDIIDKSKEVVNYIRHESTLKLLSEHLNIELKPSSDLYKHAPGDIIIVTTLKKPVRGSEVAHVTAEDLDLFMCVVLELPQQHQ